MSKFTLHDLALAGRGRCDEPLVHSRSHPSGYAGGDALSATRQAALSSNVQAGFVVGALFSAIFGLADRFDPRHVFAISAIAAALFNAMLLIADPGSFAAIGARFATGTLLAGVYPIGMKIAVGWGQKDRGFLVGILVGALTLGSALPHLLAFAGGANWRFVVIMASIASAIAGLICLAVSLGPYHSVAARFDPKAIKTAWTNRRVRLAYAGYLGYMWELYAMWAWIAAATAASYARTLAEPMALAWSKITTFIAIGAGAFSSAFAGFVADRIGKAEVATIAMSLSGLSALLTALTFGGPVWLTFAIVVVWGMTIVPDSAQFSALVADASPADQASSLMTLQTSLGFALTFAVGPGYADPGRLAWLATRAGHPGAWASFRDHRHGQTSYHRSYRPSRRHGLNIIAVFKARAVPMPGGLVQSRESQVIEPAHQIARAPTYSKNSDDDARSLWFCINFSKHHRSSCWARYISEQRLLFLKACYLPLGCKAATKRRQQNSLKKKGGRSLHSKCCSLEHAAFAAYPCKNLFTAFRQ